MNIKNYTSTVPFSTSMAKIESCLVEIGASNISKKYVDKVCTGITFLYLDTRMQQTIAFHLRAQVDECYNIFYAQVKRPNADSKTRCIEQAQRTSWKILSDWTEIQCSMILLGQAELLQMFLPFVYDMKTDQTYYDKIVSNEIKLLN